MLAENCRMIVALVKEYSVTRRAQTAIASSVFTDHRLLQVPLVEPEECDWTTGFCLDHAMRAAIFAGPDPAANLDREIVLLVVNPRGEAIT